MKIYCPWCGERDLTEFTFGGPEDVIRPQTPEKATDEEWGNYLFYRDNPKGLHRERWVHSWGCRQWFSVVRDTVTHEIIPSEASSSPTPEKSEGQS